MIRLIAIRPLARADLRDIADYSEAQWGRSQARQYLAELASTFDRIANLPMAGSDQGKIAPGLRKWRSGSHHIYYRIVDDTVLIVRVLHTRSDVARIRSTLQSPGPDYRAEP